MCIVHFEIIIRAFLCYAVAEIGVVSSIKDFYYINNVKYISMELKAATFSIGYSDLLC